MKNKLIQHQECIIFGKWDAKRSTLMGMKIISTKEDMEETSNFEAVYRTNKSIRQSTLLKLIQTALPLYKENIPNPLPASIQKKDNYYHIQKRLKECIFQKMNVIQNNLDSN